MIGTALATFCIFTAPAFLAIPVVLVYMLYKEHEREKKIQKYLDKYSLRDMGYDPHKIGKEAIDKIRDDGGQK